MFIIPLYPTKYSWVDFNLEKVKYVLIESSIGTVGKMLLRKNRKLRKESRKKL